MLVWDNIGLGTEIACPEIEKSLTSPTIEDRILGESRQGTASTTCIQMFSGNNVQFGGDMASRGLVVRLSADDPRPEDRHVEHDDPLAWTQMHRARILHALYTILLYGCRDRPADQEAKTRFKTWWSLVGWPVELAAALLEPAVELDFTALFKKTEKHDTRAAGIAAALRLLRQHFGSAERDSKVPDKVRFMARQIRTLLDAGEKARAQSRGSGVQTSSDVAITTADAFLEMVEDLAEKRHRNPSTKVIGRALAKVINRPVDLDQTTVGILRTRISAGNAQFHVETHGGTSTPQTASGGAVVDYKSTSEGAGTADSTEFRPDEKPDEPDVFEVEI